MLCFGHGLSICARQQLEITSIELACRILRCRLLVATQSLTVIYVLEGRRVSRGCMMIAVASFDSNIATLPGGKHMWELRYSGYVLYS